jgi:hypothetical protein
MAELRLLPLDETLSTAQMSTLSKELHEFGIDGIPESDDDSDLEEVLGDDQLTDFMDRLEAHDQACDVYLPVEFEGAVEVGGQSFGSAYGLLDALEELRDELDIDDEGSNDEDDDLDMEVIEEQMRFAWRVFFRAASTCVDRQVPLHVIS